MAVRISSSSISPSALKLADSEDWRPSFSFSRIQRCSADPEALNAKLYPIAGYEGMTDLSEQRDSAQKIASILTVLLKKRRVRLTDIYRTASSRSAAAARFGSPPA